ncbi:unnamed protein product [Notodromas monacha]|uniref:Uncharacterized protein n=1 Tax=Notodromas monacha TaxID=399045 RepID=A0A7R9GJA7_9CRUS|nr:unnamed protein product [Notodromas monacha]CAG0923346.1 unnamed protein product [Notodromas monacha]
MPVVLLHSMVVLPPVAKFPAFPTPSPVSSRPPQSPAHQEGVGSPNCPTTQRPLLVDGHKNLGSSPLDGRRPHGRRVMMMTLRAECRHRQRSKVFLRSLLTLLRCLPSPGYASGGYFPHKPDEIPSHFNHPCENISAGGADLHQKAGAAAAAENQQQELSTPRRKRRCCSCCCCRTFLSVVQFSALGLFAAFGVFVLVIASRVTANENPSTLARVVAATKGWIAKQLGDYCKIDA